jgi:hypothetical protein
VNIGERFKFGDEESRVQAMESVSERGRSWVVICLEGSISSPNPDAIDTCKHNSATGP